ncbi:MAG: protein translocase subunit SecD, partial [Desulfurobacterium sp.]
MKSLKLRIAIVLLVLLGSLYVVLTKPVTLGLDLQGGTHLVLQIDVEKAMEDEVSAALR